MATYSQKVVKVCEILCKSGKFETGEGTCAPICMGMLGNARKNCTHRVPVHFKLANSIITAIVEIPDDL